MRVSENQPRRIEDESGTHNVLDTISHLVRIDRGCVYEDNCRGDLIKNRRRSLDTVSSFQLRSNRSLKTRMGREKLLQVGMLLEIVRVDDKRWVPPEIRHNRRMIIQELVKVLEIAAALIAHLLLLRRGPSCRRRV